MKLLIGNGCRVQVKCLMSDNRYSQSDIRAMVRQSLRGIAFNLMMDLGEHVDPAVLLSTFDSAFGSVYSSSQLMELFHSAKQKPGESIVLWFCRVQQLMGELKEVDRPAKESDLLRTKFFYGLSNTEIKEAIRHKFDQGQTFDQLFVAARAIESEKSGGPSNYPASGTKPVKRPVVSQQADTSNKKLEDILTELKSVSKRLTALETREQQGHRSRSQTNEKSGKTSKPEEVKKMPTGSNRAKFFCGQCGRRGHTKDRCHATTDVDGNPLN